MLIITIAGFGYATFNDSINTIAELSNADYSIEITDCQVVKYNGIAYQLFWDQTGVSFNDSDLFPGWELIINTTIHNKAEDQSWVCVIYYTLHYWNNTINDWTLTNEAELQQLFGISYTGEFYLDAGWTTLMPPNYEIQPNQNVYHKEQFVYDGTQNPQLADPNFAIKVTVYATYPQVDEGLGGG